MQVLAKPIGNKTAFSRPTAAVTSFATAYGSNACKYVRFCGQSIGRVQAAFTGESSDQ